MTSVSTVLRFCKGMSACSRLPLRYTPHTLNLAFHMNNSRRTFAAQIGAAAPTFNATAVVGTKFETIKLEDFKGKWVVLFFYPLDFTFVCPTEIIEFNSKLDQFRKFNAEVLGASVDSQFAHLEWIQTPLAEGGVGLLEMPLIADISRDISSAYGCLQSDGVSVRATYIIDPKGIVKHITLNDRAVGRNVDELLRLVEAFQFADKFDVVCPVNWQSGDDAIKPDPFAKLEYFEKQHAQPPQDEEEDHGEDNDNNTNADPNK